MSFLLEWYASSVEKNARNNVPKHKINTGSNRDLLSEFLGF